MKRKKAFAIVVDASVYGGAGRGPESGPGVIPCINALNAIKDAQLLVVVSPRLLEEGHIGPFARKWMVQMFARRKVYRVNDPPVLDALRNLLPDLEEAGVANAISKDLHLVEAALGTDKRILSLDERMRGHLGKLAARIAELSQIHWANPRHPQCHTWLLDGAPDIAMYLLG
jgi:hypothetical protein